MVNKYRQGANIERLAVNKAIEDGALLSGRFAGSKCRGKYKIDVLELWKDKIILTQYKKGKITKKERDDLNELAGILDHPLPIEVKIVERIKNENKD